jgi:hypothetical protein
MSNTNTYWNSKGKYQTVAMKLQDLIPGSGPVESPRKNKALEKLRKATNCYYDLYNNGLYNRARQFYQIFKIPAMEYRMGRYGFSEYLYNELEAKMDEIIENAAIEQGLNHLLLVKETA